MPKLIKEEAKRIYLNRQKTEYLNNKSSLKKLLSILFLKYFRHDGYSLYQNDNAVLSMLYINDKPAAMFSGILNKSGDRIVIPRLAIDTNYKFYSPGYILIYESIKYLTKETHVNHLDLCRGTEKYKLDMGGMIYSTEFVEVK